MNTAALPPPVGVFGGTFDPVHFGHLRPALEVKQSLGLETLHLIPCNIPPHRGAPHATPEQRCAMLELAIGDEAGFVLDRRELRRSGPSYMVETLRSLREEYGPSRPLCLIMGGDAFVGLPSWYHWQELTELAHIVVTHRPGWVLDETQLKPSLNEFLSAHRLDEAMPLKAQPSGGVWMQAVTQFDISATQIRQAVATGDNVRFLLPQSVWEYIRQHNLYRSV